MDCSVPSRILYLLLISLIAAANSHNNTSNQNPRIVNGYVTRGSMGFVVSVQLLEGSSYTRLGSGSVISPDFVITAAHIIDRQDETKLSIQAGVMDLTETGSRYDVLGYKVHEDFLAVGTYANDIAIIKVTVPFVLDGVTIASINYISATVVDDGYPVVMSGWGRTNVLGLTTSLFSNLYNDNMLHAISVTTISNNRCRLTYPEITSTNICTDGYYGGACRGDGGGPVTNTGGTLLIGIISNGPRICGTIGSPDIHTRISEFNTWIAEQMGETFP